MCTCEQPYWMTRPRDMLPLWVEPEVLDLVRWARNLPPGRKATYWPSMDPGYFTPAEAMDARFPASEHGAPNRRAWWERVYKAAHDANVVEEISWSVYRLTPLADDLPTTDPLVRTY